MSTYSAMKLIVLIFTLFFSGVSSEFWKPGDIKDYLCLKKNKHREVIPNKDVYKAIFRLDCSTLARMLAARVFNNYNMFRLPKLTHEWEYDYRLKPLEQRLRTYGMTIAKRDARGDNNCFYHALRLAFMKHGYSVAVLSNFINEQMPRSIKEAVKRMKTEGPFYSIDELKRLFYIYQWGMDPDIKESVTLLERHDFIKRLVIYNAHYEYNLEPGVRVEGAPFKVDLRGHQKRVDERESIQTVAPEVFRLYKEAHDDLFATDVSMSYLEDIFSFKFVLFNRTAEHITCGYLPGNRRIEFIITLYNDNNKHYALQGLVDLFDPHEPYEPKSVMLARDIPLPLAIMMADDCR